MCSHLSHCTKHNIMHNLDQEVAYNSAETEVVAVFQMGDIIS